MTDINIQMIDNSIQHTDIYHSNRQMTYITIKPTDYERDIKPTHTDISMKQTDTSISQTDERYHTHLYHRYMQISINQWLETETPGLSSK